MYLAQKNGARLGRLLRVFLDVAATLWSERLD